jgi:hypothetical protein
MSVVMQEIIVTIVALGAAGLVLRRFVFRKKDAPACPSCGSGKSCESAPNDAALPETAPLTFIRPGSSGSRHTQP